MIRIPWPAKMECFEPGCQKSNPADLFLTGSGGLVFRPGTDATGWQVEIQGGGMGVIVCRCPQHVKLVETPVLGGVQ